MPANNLKYVLDENSNFVIFPKHNHAVAHVDFKRYLGKIKSAGFMTVNRINGRVSCGGRSDSLNVDSIPDTDSHFFTDFFRHKNICYIHGCSLVVFATNMYESNFSVWNVENVTNCANLTDIVHL